MSSPFSTAPLSRRQFLRRMGIATGGMLSLSLLHDLDAFGKTDKPLEIVIVGAGLAGLCAAYELEKRGHKVTILEADKKHVGGRVRTLRFNDGLYGEAGAMRIPEKHWLTRKYVKELGLTLRPFVQSNPNAYYYLRGKKIRIRDAAKLNELYDLSPTEKAKSIGALWDESVGKIMAGLTDAEKADLCSNILQTDKIRSLDQLTLQQVFEQGGLSPEAIELVANANGLETTLPTAASIVLREELEEVWAKKFDEIVGGTDRLPAAFAAKLKAPIAHGCEVLRIEQNIHTKRAAAVYREDGKIRREEGDWLICTLPLPVLQRTEIEPAFSGGKMRAIRQLNYDSATKVLAVCKQRFWESEDGIYGGGTYSDLPVTTTYYPADNAFAKDPKVTAGPGVMLAAYNWGQAARRLASLPHKERSQVVIEHLSHIHPQLKSEKYLDRTASWSWDNFAWSSGAFAWFMPGQHSALHRHIISPEGRVLLAGEHASLTHTWMQGALESGLNAVKTIAEGSV